MNNLAAINEVIKASPAIQIQSKITFLQRRAWNVLLANAYNELPNTDIHHVNVSELARKLGFNSHNEDYLKETLEALVDCTVEWNILGKEKKQEWGVASLLASAKIKDGICTYGFAPHLRLQLHNPRIYYSIPTPVNWIYFPVNGTRLLRLHSLLYRLLFSPFQSLLRPLLRSSVSGDPDILANASA